MLALIDAYVCVPRRLRFIARWLVMCLFIVVLILVLILFSQILLTLPTYGEGFVKSALASATVSRLYPLRSIPNHHSKEGN